MYSESEQKTGEEKKKMTNLPIVTAVISFGCIAALLATVCELRDLRDSYFKLEHEWYKANGLLNKYISRLRKAEATLMALTEAHNITAEELEALANSIKDGIDDGK